MTSIRAKHVRDWRERTKARLIKALGGKCCLCGYDTCQAAFDMHHVIESEKSHEISYLQSRHRPWDVIFAEARKCVLLCANCHREVHAGDATIPDDVARIDEAYAEYKTVREQDDCPICHGLKNVTAKSCSRKCSAILISPANWDEYDLHEMYKTLNYTQMGIIVGVSGNAIKKRMIKQTIAI